MSCTEPLNICKDTSAALYQAGEALLAPIAGHSDLPMRLSARRHSCKYAFTEMVDAGSLVFGNEKTCKMLMARDPSEEFLGIQLVGSDHEHLAKAAQIINTLPFDVLDFNLGCPAPKVARKCEGAMFAATKPEEAVRAFSVLVKNSSIPVTVKTRILSESDPEPTVKFCKSLEDAGAQTLTLHGRLMKNFYSGPVFFDVIRAVRESLHIPVIANGGGLTQSLYAELIRETGCSNGMVARGACGNPWIFREIRSGKMDPPALSEFLTEIRLHFECMVRFYGEDSACRIGRKTILSYLRGRGFPGELRASVSYLSSVQDFEDLMKALARGPSPRYYQMLLLDPGMERRLKVEL